MLICQIKYKIHKVRFIAATDKTTGIDSKVLLYVNNVLDAPNIIPSSRAMKRVPAPTPRREVGERSAVHANRVGLVIPVAIPNTMAAVVNIFHSLELINIKTLMSSMDMPITRVFLLPILSDNPLKKKRTKIVDET